MQIDLKTILVIGFIGLLVLSVNLTLFGLLRGDKGLRAEAGKWGMAVGGARQAQAKQAADTDALHRAVAELQADQAPTEPPPHE